MCNDFPLMGFFVLNFSIVCVTFAMRAFGTFCCEWLTADVSDVADPFSRTLYLSGNCFVV